MMFVHAGFYDMQSLYRIGTASSRMKKTAQNAACLTGMPEVPITSGKDMIEMSPVAHAAGRDNCSLDDHIARF